MFVLANAAGLFAVGMVAIYPVLDELRARDALITEQRSTLARLKELANQEGTIQAAAKQAPGDTGEYLIGANEGVTNANLQTRLKSMVESAGARLRAVRTLTPQNIKQAKLIGSRIEIYGPLLAIHRGINAIETSQPYLFIQGALIKLAPPPANTPSISEEPVFDAQLDVFGALRLSSEPR